MSSLTPFIPFVIAFAILIGALWVVNWMLIGRHDDLGNERKFPRHLVMLSLTLLSLLILAFTLPVSESSRNQLIGLAGLLISGTLAFSSTTIFANLTAGILIRITRPFNVGDFIRVNDYFGRVTERGLFDTELQSENRELVALPNTYLISNPVSTVRQSGTVISVSLSLGYDVHHSRIENLLSKAAVSCGLEDPFVHILELGNYSVTYRVSGFLADIKGLITARSNLFRTVLDSLHMAGIEIISPSFMNQRRLGDEERAIPTDNTTEKEAAKIGAIAENIVFDKAETAEKTEREKQQLIETIQVLEERLGSTTEEERQQLKDEIKNKKSLLEDAGN